MTLPSGELPYQTPGPVVAPPPPPRRFEWRRAAWLGGLVAFIALCGIGILTYVGYNIGPVALAVGFVAAIIPVPVLVISFLWLDRYEPEPVKYLLFCFAWGAFVATSVALAVNTGGAWLFRHVGLPDALVAVVVAPVIEESMKAAGPILLFWRRREAVSGVVDGIVYCGLSATGFAMVENILYLGGYGYAANADKGGVAQAVAAVIAIFIGRIVLSGFAHPLFTSMTGIGLGVAARTGDRWVRRLAPVAGLLTAMLLHSSWNLMATVANEANQPLVLLYGYFSVMMPIFFGMVGFAIWLRGYEARLTQRVLPVYVRAGWLSPPEVASLATVGRRLSARRWARRVAGEPGAGAMRGYQFTATQLALLRDAMQRGSARLTPQSAQQEERRLLDAITAYRAVYTGRDPLAPQALWDGSRYLLRFPDGQVREWQPPAQPVVPVPLVLAPASGGTPPPY
ncbi:MAG TPA: PrsW family intramembrane metalloprotease [Micromonosporaceae bacterium]